MFSIDSILNRRKPRESLAEDHGSNDAWLGLGNQNPYPIGTAPYVAYNTGYLEAEELIDEFTHAKIPGVPDIMCDI